MPSHPGIEPGTFGLEVQRAIRCANGTCYEDDRTHIHTVLEPKVFLETGAVCSRKFQFRLQGSGAEIFLHSILYFVFATKLFTVPLYNCYFTVL